MDDADAQAPGQQQGQRQNQADGAQRDDPRLLVAGACGLYSGGRTLFVQFPQQLNLHVHQVALQREHGVGQHPGLVQLVLLDQRNLILQAGHESLVGILQRNNRVMLSARLNAREVFREAFLDLVPELFDIDLAVDDGTRIVGVGDQTGGFAAQFDQADGDGIGGGDTGQGAALDRLALGTNSLHLQQAERAQRDHQQRGDGEADHQAQRDFEAAQECCRCGLPT